MLALIAHALEWVLNIVAGSTGIFVELVIIREGHYIVEQLERTFMSTDLIDVIVSYTCYLYMQMTSRFICQDSSSCFVVILVLLSLLSVISI